MVTTQNAFTITSIDTHKYSLTYLLSYCFAYLLPNLRTIISINRS